MIINIDAVTIDNKSLNSNFKCVQLRKKKKWKCWNICWLKNCCCCFLSFPFNENNGKKEEIIFRHNICLLPMFYICLGVCVWLNAFIISKFSIIWFNSDFYFSTRPQNYWRNGKFIELIFFCLACFVLLFLSLTSHNLRSGERSHSLAISLIFKKMITAFSRHHSVVMCVYASIFFLFSFLFLQFYPMRFCSPLFPTLFFSFYFLVLLCVGVCSFMFFSIFIGITLTFFLIINVCVCISMPHDIFYKKISKESLKIKKKKCTHTRARKVTLMIIMLISNKLYFYSLYLYEYLQYNKKNLNECAPPGGNFSPGIFRKFCACVRCTS